MQNPSEQQPLVLVGFSPPMVSSTSSSRFMEEVPGNAPAAFNAASAAAPGVVSATTTALMRIAANLCNGI